jgi:hypothetical protein
MVAAAACYRSRCPILGAVALKLAGGAVWSGWLSKPSAIVAASWR